MGNCHVTTTLGFTGLLGLLDFLYKVRHHIPLESLKNSSLFMVLLFPSIRVFVQDQERKFINFTV